MKTGLPIIDASLVSGMDGQTIINKNIQRLADMAEDERLVAGDGVDFAIHCAYQQAERQGEGLAEVINHLRYIRLQIAIFERNAEEWVAKHHEHIEISHLDFSELDKHTTSTLPFPAP